MKLYRTKQFLSEKPTSNAVMYNDLLFIGDDKGFVNILDVVSLQSKKFKVSDK